MPILSTGLDEAEQISEALKKGSAFYRIANLVMKDGDAPVILRFYTPHNKVVSFDTHQFIPTKAKPAGWPGDKYPQSMWAICQNDKAFRLRDSAGNLTDDFDPGYGDCHIHKIMAGEKDKKYGTPLSRPAAQVYGLAVEREAIFDEKTGQPVGFRDKTTEYKDKDGKVWQIPKFVLVSQKYSNFWHPIKATAYLPPHTILDKDFMVTRKGNDYTVTVAMQTPDHQPGTESWKRYDEALALTGFNMEDYLLDHASPDHYKRFFIEGQDPEGGYGRGGDEDQEQQETTVSAAAAQSPVSTPQVSADALAAFRQDLGGRGKTAEPAPAS